jgi:hypothetical protein
LYLLTSPICKDAHFLQNNNKNQYTKPFHWVILKKADAVSMVTSAKYDGAFYNTPPPPPPQTTGNTLTLFQKPIVYERLVFKL